MDNINTTVNELQELGTTLRIQLNQTRENLTEVRKSCNTDPDASAAGVCDKIPKGDQLKPVANFSKVSWTYSGLLRLVYTYGSEILLQYGI